MAGSLNNTLTSATVIAAGIGAVATLAVGLITRKPTPKEAATLRRDTVIAVMNELDPIFSELNTIRLPTDPSQHPGWVVRRTAEVRTKLDSFVRQLYIVGDDNMVLTLSRYQLKLDVLLGPHEQVGEFSLEKNLREFQTDILDAARSTISDAGRPPLHVRRSRALFLTAVFLLAVSFTGIVMWLLQLITQPHPWTLTSDMAFELDLMMVPLLLAGVLTLAVTRYLQRVVRKTESYRRAMWEQRWKERAGYADATRDSDVNITG